VTKETRANLLFLAIFLAISLPGGVILFKKKLDPSLPPSYMPERTRQALPYNSPEEAPDLKRYVPDKTGTWVTSLARQHGYADVLIRDRLPVMLGERRWQLIGTHSDNNGTRADLLQWGSEQPGSTAEWSATQDQTDVQGKVDASQPLAIPEPVRKELVYGGYPKPPKEATWVSVLFPGLTSPKPGTMIHLRHTTHGRIRTDSVPLFTK
jgi:hypothetical protein